MQWWRELEVVKFLAAEVYPLIPFAFQSQPLAANPKACSKGVWDSDGDGGGSDFVSA
jgi:hypothetical protein